jgi:polyphosphate kinase 2 (PPK2 family)
MINEFEKRVARSDTLILKFFLHIDKDEQLKRLAERIDDPAKHWKVTESDFTDREKWSDFEEAYEDALTKCSTKYAPWFVIPANKKWFRDLVIVSRFVCAYGSNFNDLLCM